MKLRKITSLTALLAFILMMLTSIVLFVVPQGRVAYWSDWRFLGLSKTDWGNIHINMGLLFFIALGFHLYYNWKPMVSYLKNKRKQFKIFTPEFSVAVMLTAVFVAGTYLLAPPFSWVMGLNDRFKDTVARKYGEPPYGHAELSSLKTFTKKMNLDLRQSMDQLGAAGVRIENADQTLLEVAKLNGISPQEVFLKMNAGHAPRGNPAPQWPDMPPPGFGRRTLADIGAEYQLNLPDLLRRLDERGIQAAAGKTVKAVAQENGKQPIEIYYLLKEVARDMSF